MTDQELRNAWLETQSRLEKIESQINCDSANGFNANRKTSLDNLIRRYKTFACIGVGMTLCSFGWFNSHILEGTAGHILPIVMIGYFLLAALMDMYLMNGLQSINLSTMSVSKVCELVAKYRKFHHRCMIVLIPICIVLIGIMVSAFISDTYMIIGIIFGAIIGLAIGIMQYRRFMDDYRILSED